MGGDPSRGASGATAEEGAGRTLAAPSARGDLGPTERLLIAGERLAQMGSWELDLASGEMFCSEELNRILGTAPEEAGRDPADVLERIHPDDRDRIQALAAAIAEGADLASDEALTGDVRVVRPDGSVRDLRARAVVERDEAGRPVRCIGVAQDLTAQRMSERGLDAHHAVSETLREWDDLELGVVDLLRRLGTALEYSMGSLWLWDDDEEALGCRAFWSRPNVHSAYFEQQKRRCIFKPGQGKPGIAWQTQQPVVTPNAFDDPVFQPREAAIIGGVCSGLAFPAMGADGPVAVLSFYSFTHRVPRESFLRTLTAIGHELGHFLSRRRAELGHRPLSGRELDVLRLAAEGNSGPAIADQLCISPATVKTHFEHIYEKLGVSDRAAAVAHGLRTGLIR